MLRYFFSYELDMKLHIISATLKKVEKTMERMTMASAHRDAESCLIDFSGNQH